MGKATFEGRPKDLCLVGSVEVAILVEVWVKARCYIFAHHIGCSVTHRNSIRVDHGQEPYLILAPELVN